jgi:hypothetical protein
MGEKSDIFEWLERQVCFVASELFEGSGYVPCFLRTAALPHTVGRGVLAVMGFAGDGCKGSIALLGAPEAAIVLRSGADRASATDVLGEFCNMLMGRLKNRLALRGVEVASTLPVVTAADNIQLQLTPFVSSAWHEVRIAAGTLFVRLDAEIGDGFRFAKVNTADPPSTANEGECILF